MPPKLCYFRDSSILSCAAQVTGTVPAAAAGALMVRFDRTVFYPQGGGQPSDQGEVRSGNFIAKVAKVTHAENDEVDHLVTCDSEISTFLYQGAEVTMAVDEALRRWHSRLHSAGHVVDAALARLAITLVPTKGYHYEDGAYVEYEGTIEGEKSEIAKRIETACKEIIHEDHQVFIDFSDDSDDRKCQRSMRIGNIVSIPCGGTHVSTLKEIGNMTIRKVDIKKGKTRVCYAVEK